MSGTTTIDSGVLRDAYGYVRIGSGPQTLLVLPGMALDNDPPGRWLARSYSYGLRHLAERYALYVVQRRRGLPAGADTRDIAADYAQLIAEELGPVELVGLSTGGMIAQHLALDHQDLVRHLVLVVSGARLGPTGQQICRQWQELAGSGDWRGVRGGLTAVVVDGPTAQRLARLFGAQLGRRRPPAPVDAGDFATTVSAVRRHDTRERLTGLQVPTLVIGGSDDPFFPADFLQETAGAIPGAELRVYPGVGHALPKRHGSRMQADIAQFLSG